MSKTLRLHNIIAGYTQTKSRWHGSVILREKMQEAVDELSNNCQFRRVWIHRWNEHWAEMAQRIWWLGQYHEREIEVGIYAYSWGAGWGFIQLAKELRELGITVKHAVLCDPVYRHNYPLGNWRAFSNHPLLSWCMRTKIIVPDNVKEVFVYRQNLNYPKGFDVESKNPTTVIHPAVGLKCTHQTIDEREEYHNRSIQQALLL